jgi:hypothetical protein
VSGLAISAKGNGKEFVAIGMLLIPISVLTIVQITIAAKGLTSCREQSCMPHLPGC